MRGTVAADL